MIDFGELQKVPLRKIWPHEADDFTPWLEENIEALGDALGLQLEVTNREAPVGDFSLDLLAKDLDSLRTVIIENQFSQTDHDHLGKLLTYAAGSDASTVIWISERVRDEHRQALEWLNQKTGIDTQFFAVVVEVLRIDDSKPAFNFKPIVVPNEWQKSRRQKSSTNILSRIESRYKLYFQELIDELRENHDFIGARRAQPRSWCDFSSNFQGICFRASFLQYVKPPSRAYAAIYIERDIQEQTKAIFDALEKRKTEIISEFGGQLEWERRFGQKCSIIAIGCHALIESSDSELEEFRQWHIQNLLKLKEVFTPEIERALETIDNGEL